MFFTISSFPVLTGGKAFLFLICPEGSTIAKSGENIIKR